MYFINDKCVVDEVGSYCQLAVTFFVSPYQTRRCSASVHLSPPFHKSGSPLPLCLIAIIYYGVFTVPVL